MYIVLINEADNDSHLEFFDSFEELQNSYEWEDIDLNYMSLDVYKNKEHLFNSYLHIKITKDGIKACDPPRKNYNDILITQEFLDKLEKGE